MVKLLETSLLEKVRRARENEKLSRDLENQVDVAKREVWDTLQERYSLLLSKENQDSYSWNSDLFNDELQLILRSVLKRDRVFHIPGKKDQSEGYNLTSQHGLKYPRTWSDYNFLPYHEETNLTFKNEKYSSGDYTEIDFSVLRNSKYIDIPKLEKFFYFFRKVLKLYALREKIEKKFEKNFKGEKEFGNVRTLGNYSELEAFEKFLKVESKLTEHYQSYAGQLKDYKLQVEQLLKELKEFNKPFRLFLTLKDGSNN